MLHSSCFLSFFFTDTAPTEIYTLSLHDALPISRQRARPRRGRDHRWRVRRDQQVARRRRAHAPAGVDHRRRSEEHTSELQSRQYLVCRLLLEKKKKNRTMINAFA